MPRKDKPSTIRVSGGKNNPRPLADKFHLLPCQIHISGRPILDLDFHAVPSRNTQKGWQSHMNKIAEWRFDAREQALNARGLEWDDTFIAQLDPMIKGRAMVVVTVYVRNQGISDITNPDLKPIFDGFSDAGVWPDDEWAWLPAVLYVWGGFSDTGQNRVNIKVFELQGYYIHSEEQPLPEGRVRL